MNDTSRALTAYCLDGGPRPWPLSRRVSWPQCNPGFHHSSRLDCKSPPFGDQALTRLDNFRFLGYLPWRETSLR
jgi:hypothetical protein